MSQLCCSLVLYLSSLLHSIILIIKTLKQGGNSGLEVEKYNQVQKYFKVPQSSLK